MKDIYFSYFYRAGVYLAKRIDKMITLNFRLTRLSPQRYNRLNLTRKYSTGMSHYILFK